MQVNETTKQLAERSAELDAQREMLTTEDERLTGVLADVKQGRQPIITSNRTCLNGDSQRDLGRGS